jgi:S1-C subfamily serine protease
VRRLRLRYLSGPRRGDELIFSGPRVRIGRSRDNTLILTQSETPASSGHHADALVERGVWWIVDAGSTNGTYVNGARVERGRLRAGDLLSFGDDRFVVAGGSRALWLTAGAVLALAAMVAGVTYATRRRSPMSYEEIASTAARSVYAVAIEEGGRRSIVGTAFAVERGLLATNAHVASLLRERNAFAPVPSARGLAVRGDSYEVARITGVAIHPDWQPGSLRADAGVLQLERGTATAPLTLAADAAFKRLQRGASLVSFGFPAASTDAERPRGRLSVDVVGDIRGEYVQAGLAIVPGTSGSPVFDDQGAVVAVVAGGDFVKGTDGRLLPSGSQANWAISVERVREVLERGR